MPHTAQAKSLFSCRPWARVLALGLVAAACTDGPTAPASTVAAVDIQLATSAVRVSVRESVTLAAIARDTKGTPLDAVTILWSVGDSAVAQISAAGVLTGRAAGETYVFAVAGAQRDSVLAQISGVPIASVDISLDSLVIGGGYSFQMEAAAVDTFGTSDTQYPFVWRSSDTTVARVDRSGVVTAVRPGTAEVRALAGAQSALVTVQVEPAYSRIYSSYVHSCALDVGGNAYCWGSNLSGQLGHGVEWDRSVLPNPVPVAGGHRFRHLSLGEWFTCGLRIDGEVLCWGRNDLAEGGIGDSTVQRIHAPTQIALNGPFTQVVAGEEHACALDTGGRAYCWGLNHHGQLGRGTTMMFPGWNPEPVLGDVRFKELISSAYSLTCGLSMDYEMYCWGSVHLYGGDAEHCDDDGCAMPTPLPGTPPIAGLGAAYQITCGLTSAGVAHCLNQRTSEFRAINGGAPFEWLTSGLSLNVCGLTSEGRGYCWGLDAARPWDIALPIPGDLTLTWLSGGGYGPHGCGVTNLGVAYCWRSSMTDGKPQVLPRPDPPPGI